MNRLFLRMFLLLTLAVIGSSALVMSWFDYSVFPSESRQLEGTVGPGVQALASRIGAGEDPETVVESARAYVGSTIALIPLDLVPLTEAERDRLLVGDVVISGDGPLRSAWAAVPDRELVVEFELLSYHRSRSIWVGLPETRVVARPATPTELAELTELDRARLRWRSVSLDRSRVVSETRGQIQVVDLPTHYRGRELAMGLTLLGTALVLLLTLLPVRRELLALDVGARRLREGDLAARVQIGARPGPVAQVSQQVNAMADRVQTLVGSHEELLRSVSHELQTPLARLLFALDALQDQPERGDELIGGMRTTVDEMRALAEEVLQFNRLGGDPDLLLDSEAIDLGELAGDVALAFDDVRVEAPAEGAFVDGDARLLYRALRNLVENAVVYATPPVLRVVLSPESVQIHVDDAGPGIPEAERSRVFDPFHRIEGSRARATGGTGLGLAIVRRIARRHGGSVTAGPSPDGGARLTLTIPRP